MDELRQNSTRGLPPWQLAIIQAFPKIYLEESPEILKLYASRPEQLDREHHCNLRFGFEFKQGWRDLIFELSQTGAALVSALTSFGLQEDARISACIAKEKFGQLRWDGTDNLIEPFHRLWWGYTAKVQVRTASTCEICGEYGEIRCTRGWFRARCDKHVKTA